MDARLVPRDDGRVITHPEIGLESLDVLVDYLVERDEGSILGVVDGVECESAGNPASLMVEDGWFGRRKRRISIGAIWAVDHVGRRVFLRTNPGPTPIEIVPGGEGTRGCPER